MDNHQFPVWIQTVIWICCLTLSTHKPWSTMSSLRLVCKALSLLCLKARMRRCTLSLSRCPCVHQRHCPSVQVGSGLLAWTPSSWLQSCRRCRSSRPPAWSDQGWGLGAWVCCQRLSALPSSTRERDQRPPAAYPALASPHPPPSTRSRGLRYGVRSHDTRSSVVRRLQWPEYEEQKLTQKGHVPHQAPLHKRLLWDDLFLIDFMKTHN